MSLDIWLEDPTATYEVGKLFSANITHNLSKMANEAGIYTALWRPDENGYVNAKDIEPVLDEGLADLRSRRSYFEKFDAANGWGTYEHFVPFVEEVLEACRKYPDARIGVSR